MLRNDETEYARRHHLNLQPLLRVERNKERKKNSKTFYFFADRKFGC